MTKTRRRKTQRRKRRTRGGSYLAPFDAENVSALRRETYTPLYVNAHGTITPEYFYVVPPRVYLLFRTSCGTQIHASDTYSTGLFTTYEEARRGFEQKFMNASETAATSTVQTRIYTPGDIIPLHFTEFNPLYSTNVDEFLSNTTDIFLFSYVGVFNSAAFYDFPVATHIIGKEEDEKLNLFTRRRTKLITNTYSAGKYLLTILNYLYNHPTNSGRYIPFIRANLDWTDPPLTIENVKEGTFPSMYTKVHYDKMVHLYSMFMSILPQNLMRNYLMKRLLTPGGNMVDLATVVNETRDRERATVYVMNTCRVLPTTEGYEAPMKLVRRLSEIGRSSKLNKSRGPELNMQRINELREKSGQTPVHLSEKFPVLHFTHLQDILNRTLDAATATAAETDADPLIENMRELLSIIGTTLPEPVASIETMLADKAMKRWAEKTAKDAKPKA